MTQLSLFGANIFEGQKRPGTHLAADLLREKGLLQILAKGFSEVTDRGNFSYSTSLPEDHTLADYLNAHADFINRMGEKIYQSLDEGHFCLNLGGDHSCAMAPLAAGLKFDPNLKVIWVDAHADINNFSTSPTGNLHGMPLAFFLRLIAGSEAREAFSHLPYLSPDNLVYIGLRDIDPGEKDFIEDLGVRFFSARDVNHLGIEGVLSEAVDHLDPEERNNFYLSFDIDALDPEWVPCTGTPVKGGLDRDQGQAIITSLAATGRLRMMDLVEYNPLLGNAQENEQTLNTIFQLFRSLVRQYKSDFKREDQALKERFWKDLVSRDSHNNAL